RGGARRPRPPPPRLEAALELLAEVALHPTFPEAEVERLRDERLNDLLQARADPRRRADEAYASTIYEGASPYHRPAGGTKETVAELTPARLRAAYERGIDPSRAAFLVGGDLRGIDVRGILERLLGNWGPAVGAATSGRIVDAGAVHERFVHIVHRPGAVQTEIRIGHVGVPRRIDDFHALSVMGAILGGLFNSRLNIKLREEKGYTYGAGAGFDARRGVGVLPPPRRRSVQRPGRGQHRGHGPGRRRLRRRARPHPQHRGHAGRAGGRSRLPPRCAPAPVSDAASS